MPLILGGADGQGDFEIAIKLSMLKVWNWNVFLNFDLKWKFNKQMLSD